MKRLALLVAMLMLLTAGRFSPAWDGDPPRRPPIGFPGPRPGPGPGLVGGDCNAIVSMSQGQQVYYGAGGQVGPSELEGLTGEDWMALIASGKVLSWWTDPTHWQFLSERDRCGTDPEIDSIIFLFDSYGSGSCGPSGCDDGSIMRQHLTQVLGITASRYPNADTWLTMLVGSVGHVTCYVQNPFGGLSPVRASRTHANRIGQLTLPEAGPDLEVSCDQYADNLGHLTEAGAANAQTQLASWFD